MKTIEVEDDLYRWHANMFTWDRWKFVILTNDLSVYGFVMDVRKGDFQGFLKEEIRKNLLAQYASQEQVDEYLDNKIVFSKTNNRKVIGKMNALVQFSLHSFAYGEEDIARLNLKLGQYDFINSSYVGDYIIEELDKRMPDKKFDRSVLDNEAYKIWEQLPERIKARFLRNSSCYKCSCREIEFDRILDDKLSYRLESKCKECGNIVVNTISREQLDGFK